MPSLVFIARLAALVPKPRVNLIRYHGILAPNAKHRGEITASGRGRVSGKNKKAKGSCSTGGGYSGKDWQEKTPQERLRAMRWAQRLKRVFDMPQGTLS